MGFVMLALGIAAPIDAIAGGMFFAIALAFLVMAWSQPEDRKSYWLTLLTAILMALAAAVLHSAWLTSWSLQFLMGAAGLFSTFLAESAIAFGKASREQARKLPAILREKFVGKDSDG